MMNYKLLRALSPLLCLCFCFAQCKKTSYTAPQTELEKLPPITQSGANTFGCLVNGVAWLPNGRKPQTGGANIVAYVDPTFQGGRLAITAHKYNEPNQFIGIGLFRCTGSGLYNLDSIQQSVQFLKYVTGSLFINISTTDSEVYKRGYINVNKYDLANGIFSGVFEATIYKQDGTLGDTIKITNGRFDVRL